MHFLTSVYIGMEIIERGYVYHLFGWLSRLTDISDFFFMIDTLWLVFFVYSCFVYFLGILGISAFSSYIILQS